MVNEPRARLFLCITLYRNIEDKYLVLQDL